MQRRGTILRARRTREPATRRRRRPSAWHVAPDGGYRGTASTCGATLPGRVAATVRGADRTARTCGRLSPWTTTCVRQAPLFAALDDEAAAALRASMSRTHLERGDVLFHEGDPGDRSTSSPRARSSSAAPAPTAARTCSRSSARARCSASSPCSTRARARRPPPRSPRRQLLGLGHERPAALARRPPRGRPRAAGGRSPAGCAGPTTHLADLVFSDVPGRVAKALLDLADRFGRTADDGVHVAPRPHPGGARPAGRRLPRDGQQGARRLRLPRLAAPRGPRRRHPRRRAPASAAPADRPSPRDGRGPPRQGCDAQVVQLGPHAELGRRPERARSTSA